MTELTQCSLACSTSDPKGNEQENSKVSFDARVAVFIYLPSVYFLTASLRNVKRVSDLDS